MNLQLKDHEYESRRLEHILQTDYNLREREGGGGGERLGADILKG